MFLEQNRCFSLAKELSAGQAMLMRQIWMCQVSLDEKSWHLRRERISLQADQSLVRFEGLGRYVSSQVALGKFTLWILDALG